MNKMKFVLTFLFVAILSLAKSQSKCLPDSTLRTDSLGTHKEKIAIPLIFHFSNETIKVYMKGNSKDDFMLFKIIERLICNWNKELTEGKTSYKVSTAGENTTDETATLNIIFSKSGQRFIELLYDKSEERVFTISK